MGHSQALPFIKFLPLKRIFTLATPMTEQPSDRCYPQIFLIQFYKGENPGIKATRMLPMQLSFRKLVAPFL
jgi:hypothetical protein